MLYANVAATLCYDVRLLIIKRDRNVTHERRFNVETQRCHGQKSGTVDLQIMRTECTINTYSIWRFTIDYTENSKRKSARFLAMIICNMRTSIN